MAGRNGPHKNGNGRANGSQNGGNGRDLAYDEETYLRANADVAEAVRGGKLRDGYDHWVRFGKRECAEGRRARCFGQKAPDLRPFRIAVGAHGEIVVAPMQVPLADVERLTLHLNGGSSVDLDPTSIVCSHELELLDPAGRPFSPSLLFVWLASDLFPQDAHRPSALTLTLESRAGEVRSIAVTDTGEQGPSFAGIDAANGFVLAVKRLAQMHRRGSALLQAASDVACAGLALVQPADEQPFSSVHVEHLVRIDGVGIYASGWLLPASSLIDRCRAWCPETGECVDFDATLSRTVRPDVIEAFKAKAGFGGAEHLGFFALLGLPEASRRPGCRLVIGITPEGGGEQIFSPMHCKAPENFTEAAKLVLANLNPTATDFEAAMTNNVAPALERLWARERARKNRRVLTRTFGRCSEKPKASVIVPIYGRSDLMKYQLALFANDRDFRSGDIELVYFVDDPRIIEPVVQLCLSLSPLYQVPMTVAYTGENHGFSGANNLAVSVARGELLVLLNSDVMPKRSGWVTELARAYRDLPNCGVLGAKLLYYDESLQHDGMVFERFPFWNDLYGNNHPGKGLPNRSELAAPPREVEAVTGACFAISTALYREIGGLSEEFVFGDFEDSELCLRTRGAGKSIYYAPAMELYHLERQSQSLLPDGDSWRWQLTVYNSWLQHKKWGPRIDELKRPKAARNGQSKPTLPRG